MKISLMSYYSDSLFMFPDYTVVIAKNWRDHLKAKNNY